MIGDDITEIASAVKSAIQHCCIQLKTKIVKNIQAREQKERKQNLSKYAENVSGAVCGVLKQMQQIQASKKRRYDDKEAEVLKKLSSGMITKEMVKEKLVQHIEQVRWCLTCH